MDARELLEFLFPEHNGIDCSDENITCGIRESCGFMCSRCLVLDIINGKVNKDKFVEAHKDRDISIVYHGSLG